MSIVFGIANDSLDAEELSPLSFRTTANDTKHLFLRGYIEVIAPSFQEFSSDPSWSISAVNSIARISGEDIPRAREICEELRTNLMNKPPVWREHLGTIKWPGQPEEPFEPVVVRRRALAIVENIMRLLDFIEVNGGTLMSGTGVYYRRLCGIKLPPGTVEYS